MQYILTQQEKDWLVPLTEKEKRDKALVVARKRILEISKFDCIHNSDNEHCDNCPCLSTDKEEKEYKNKIGALCDLNELHNLICTLPKSFSK